MDEVDTAVLVVPVEVTLTGGGGAARSDGGVRDFATDDVIATPPTEATCSVGGDVAMATLLAPAPAPCSEDTARRDDDDGGGDNETSPGGGGGGGDVTIRRDGGELGRLADRRDIAEPTIVPSVPRAVSSVPRPVPSTPRSVPSVPRPVPTPDVLLTATPDAAVAVIPRLRPTTSAPTNELSAAAGGGGGGGGCVVDAARSELVRRSLSTMTVSSNSAYLQSDTAVYHST